MRKSITAAIRISEIRDRLTELDGIETRSAEQETESTALAAERTRVELEYRTALKSEEDEQLHPRDFTVLPETRERLEIRSKTGLADFLAAAAGGREVLGAAREYADACGVSVLNRLPMAIFADGQPETRAVTTGPAVDGPVEAPIPYVFSGSAAASLGIQMPSHGPGQVQIPRVTTAPPADTLAKDAAAPATAAVVTLDSQAPKRVSGQLELRTEDLAVFPELESMLGESLRGSLSNELDEEVINGAAAGLNGLFAQSANVNVAGAVETYATGIARFAALIDGRHAHTLADLRAVVGTSTYAFFMGLISDGRPLADYLTEQMASFRVSDRIAAIANKGQKAIVTLNAGPSPIRLWVWNSLEIVRDPYSEAGTGKVTITATALVSQVYVPHTTSQTKQVHPKLVA